MVIGICGGFQMLGRSIDDPSGVESGSVPRCMEGFGKLPVRTIMRGDKTVRRAEGCASSWTSPQFAGYEIHMGETLYENGARPFAEILRENDGQTVLDGATASSGRVWGTYIHGLFDNDAFRHSFLDMARRECGLVSTRTRVCVAAERQARIDRWADHLRKSLDMNLIRSWAGQA
jgi:adenosylcobyric acid synthase